MVSSNKIILNTLPFYNCNEPAISSKCNSSGYNQEHGSPKWNVFRKKSLHILDLNINNLPPKIDEICFIAKQSSISIFRISEFKLDSSISNCEIDTVDYHVIRMSLSMMGVELHVITKNRYLVIISQVSLITFKAFFWIFLPFANFGKCLKATWQARIYRVPW